MHFYNSKEKEGPVSDNPPENGYGGDGYPPHGYNNDYNDDGPPQCPPHTTERKLMTRIDLHVIPFLCIMYRCSLSTPYSFCMLTATVLAFLDRINIGNANVYGLTEELGLIGNQ